MSFLSEVRRRKVFQVAAVYLVVGWLILQVVDVINEPLSLPDWFDTVVIVLLAIGFPIALILSWAFDITPEGVVATTPASSASAQKTRGIEYVLVALLVLSLGWIGFTEFRPVVGTSRQVLPNSVAVLPFENLSPDPNNAYFAAGIHDTILNELAKIQDMNVIARASVLPYEDGQTPIAQIANELNVETVMEGTVQYAEGQVRITAQLIDPSTGAHLWSGNYDRPFSNIFSIQSEIAARIASALEAELLPEERARIERVPTESGPASALYLRVIAEYSRIDDPAAPPDIRSAALADLSRAIELDSEFAEAYAARSWVYTNILEYDPVPEGDWLAHKARLQAMARSDALRALELDPGLGMARAALGYIHVHNFAFDDAAVAFEKALDASPSNPQVVAYAAFSERYFNAGSPELIDLAERLIDLDPNNYRSHYLLGSVLQDAGNLEQAVVAFEKALELNPGDGATTWHLGACQIGMGNQEEGLRYIRLTDELASRGGSTQFLGTVAWGYGRLGALSDAEQISRELNQMPKDRYRDPVTRAVTFLGLRDEEQALAAMKEATDNLQLIADPYPAFMLSVNMLEDPILEGDQFKEVRDRLGFNTPTGARK